MGAWASARTDSADSRDVMDGVCTACNVALGPFGLVPPAWGGEAELNGWEGGVEWGGGE
jgi:hypothetical protein